MKRKLIKGLSISMLIVSAFMLGKATSNKEVKIKSIDNENSGSYIVTLSDGSFASVNESKGQYKFYPISMGDWDYSLNSKEELERCINTYLEIKNNCR